MKSAGEQIDNAFINSAMRFGWMSVSCNYGTWQVMDVTVLPSVRPFVNRMRHATATARTVILEMSGGFLYEKFCIHHFWYILILLYSECWCGYWISKHFLCNPYLFLDLLEKSVLILNLVGQNQWRTEGGFWGVQTPPLPKFRRYQRRPPSHNQEEPASRFPFAVHCVLMRLEFIK